MRKLKIRSYLRPAIPSDIFYKNGIGNIIEKKQVFYKEKNSETIRGPYLLLEPLFFVEKGYRNLNMMLANNLIFVLDTEKFTESILVKLPLRIVEESDILEWNNENQLIPHTVFYIVIGKEVNGPYKITAETKMPDVKKRVFRNEFFVLDKASDIELIEIETTAEAV